MRQTTLEAWGPAGALLVFRSSTLARFLASGLLNTAFGYAAFLLLLSLSLPVAAALVLSTAAGVLFNFQTSRRIVFRSHRSAAPLRFVAVYMVLLALNWLVIEGLQRGGLPAWSAQGLVVLPLALLSYWTQRTFVFAGRGDVP